MMLSFSTSFCIDEKQWFARCDITTQYGRAVIYSLPFAFDRFTLFTDSFETISNKIYLQNLMRTFMKDFLLI